MVSLFRRKKLVSYFYCVNTVDGDEDSHLSMLLLDFFCDFELASGQSKEKTCFNRALNRDCIRALPMRKLLACLDARLRKKNCHSKRSNSD